MPTPELTTDKIVAAYRSDDPRKRETMSRHILTNPQVLAMMHTAIYLSKDEDLAQHAIHEALLAFIQKICEGRFYEGNWLAYLRQIYKYKYIDIAEGSKLIKVPKTQKQHEKISTEPQYIQSYSTEDYWIQPFTPTSLEEDMHEGYELAFKIFDYLEPCRRDQCSLICRLRVERDWNYQELLEYLDQHNVEWEQKPFAKPYTQETHKKRNQRLRDRVSDCWRRLQNYLLQHPELAKTILEDL